MSDRALKVVGGLCAGAAALALALAATVAMLVGAVQNGLEAAYGAALASATGGGGGPLSAALGGYHTFIAVCVLAAITALAGTGACIALLRRRKRK